MKTSFNSPKQPQANEGKVLAVIPARYASTRFPGKPLVLLAGKPMIQHVWERVCQVPSINRVIIATDDSRIQQAAMAFGAEVSMTNPDHPSGTDRVWEVAQALPEYTWILNVQGDEPLINPAQLQAIIEARLEWVDADLLTLVTPLSADTKDWQDSNLVKVALTHKGRALYFSRSPIPYDRDQPNCPRQLWRHIGLYLYHREALATFVGLPPSPLEKLEKLEQLRALEAGFSIYALPVENAPVGVDTPEDLKRLQDLFCERFP